MTRRSETSVRLCLASLCLPLLAAGGLAGCTGVGAVAPEAAGLGAGAGAGVLSGNPVVGVAVGLGVRIATAEVIDYVNSEHQRQVHGAIAAAAGAAPPGTRIAWSDDPDFVFSTMFGTAHGHVQVVRDFGGRIPCREIVYTVETDGGVEEAIDDPATDLQTVSAAADEAGGDSAPAAATAPGGGETPLPTKAPPLVAVICRGGELDIWRWAVSQPRAGEG
jgi:hypothetical protein